MPVLAYISPNHRLPIIVVPKTSPQAEGRMQVPGLLARAEGTVEVDLAPVPIIDSPPDPGALEVLEDPTKEHVVPLLLDVDAPGPITDVEAVPAEPAREELVPLLPAQVPDPRRQMGPHGPANFPPFERGRAPCANCRPIGGILDLGPLLRGLRSAVDGIKVQVIEQRPGTNGPRLRREAQGIRIHIVNFSARGCTAGGRGGPRRPGEVLIGAKLPLETEIGVLEKDAGVEEARAADSELEEGGPCGRGRRRG